MGWVMITDLDTGKVQVIGDTPIPAWHLKDDDYICPQTGEALNEVEK